MLSEDFDKKIREAASHHHPPYDEHAWRGMKKLLDRHLPEEKDDRRRFIFFLLLFLLLGGGTALLFTGSLSGKKNDKTRIVNTDGNDKQEPGAHINNPVNENNSVRISDEGKGDENKTPAGGGAGASLNEKPSASPVLQYSSQDDRLNRPAKDEKEPGPNDFAKQKSKEAKKVKKDLRAKPEGNYEDKATVTQQTAELPDQPSDKQKAETAIAIGIPSVTRENDDNGRKEETKIGDEKPVPAANTEEKISENKAPQKKAKPAAKKKSSFFFSASAGPDVSYTGNDKLGRMKLLGGAGIGYTFREKLTLRAGFYSSRKVYTSSPEEYHGSAWFYQYYPNLQKIDANCKVHEIPVSLSYHFGGSKKSNWFASAGVSTLLMKEETYNYYYKYTPTGPTVNRSHSTYNENKHFFSVMTLSAGYQRNIGKKFSVVAEPYFKAALNGVGNGKVKLNSTGILFSVTFNPFLQAGKK